MMHLWVMDLWRLRLPLWEEMGSGCWFGWRGVCESESFL